MEVTLDPPETQRLHAEVDALAIEQVLINLLLNAIDATPQGGAVRLGAAADPQGLRIEVRDDGPGIPEHIRNHVFDPYFTTKENGTGLGLPIVYQIVNAHNGAISVRSQKGAGTTVIIDL